MVGTTDLEQALELEDIFDELYELELEESSGSLSIGSSTGDGPTAVSERIIKTAA